MNFPRWLILNLIGLFFKIWFGFGHKKIPKPRPGDSVSTTSRRAREGDLARLGCEQCRCGRQARCETSPIHGFRAFLPKQNEDSRKCRATGDSHRCACRTYPKKCCEGCFFRTLCCKSVCSPRNLQSSYRLQKRLSRAGRTPR